MQIRFACHICGQHLSATDTQSEIKCPRCKRTIMVPIRSTLPSPVPDSSPQHQHRAENVQGALLKPVKVRPSKMFQKIAVIGLIAVGACFVYASHIVPRQARPQAQTYTTTVLKCQTTFQLPSRNVTLPRGSRSSSYRATSRKYAFVIEGISNPSRLPTSILDETTD